MEFALPPIWHRRSGETAAAYIAFCYYRDMGPGRTINAAYRIAKGRTSDDSGRPVRAHSRWYAWAEDHGWEERADAYDAHVDAEVMRANVGNIAAARRQSEETAILLQSKISADIFYFPGVELVPQVDAKTGLPVIDPNTGQQVMAPVAMSLQDWLLRAQVLYRLTAAYRYATMTRLMAIGAPREEVERAGVTLESAGGAGGGGRITLSAVWEGYDEVFDEDEEPLPSAGEGADEPA